MGGSSKKRYVWEGASPATSGKVVTWTAIVGGQKKSRCMDMTWFLSRNEKQLAVKGLRVKGELKRKRSAPDNLRRSERETHDCGDLFSGLPVTNKGVYVTIKDQDKISVDAQIETPEDRGKMYRAAVGCERVDTSRGKRPDVDGRRTEN
jgi:hypothetical protein